MPSPTPHEEPHTGGDSVVDVLERAGVEVVFGIPSVHNLPIYDALARRGTIRAITVRHEQSAAAAADGYARATGRLGVFLTSTGPGAANAMGGLLEAFVSGSPVLHLTGQVETAHLDGGRGFIHEVPAQPAMLGSLSKAVLRAGSAASIAATVAEAIALAQRAPQGPVSVELPIDLQYETTEPDEVLLPEESQPGPLTLALEEAAELIARSARPLVWAGGGAVAAHAEAEVAQLVRRLSAGLLTSPNARGILPEDDPLCLGNLPWDPDVRRLVADADLLIGIGTRYQGPNTENWKMALPSRIVQIDVVPEVPGRNYPATVALAGDARHVLDHLSGQLDFLGGEPSTEPGWAERVAETSRAARGRLRSSLGGHEALLDALSDLLTDETVVVKDSTIPAYTWGNRLLPVRRTRTAIMPNGFAIGLGLAHALGVAAATPPRPVIAMVGDGGVMLGATELATLAAEQLGVTVIVFNDGGYGILRNIQDRQYGRQIGVDLGRPDFCGLARALGVEAERVDDAAGFASAVARGLAEPRPYLVEVDLSAIEPMRRPYTGTSRPPDGATKA